jgi:hypothetical protein
MCAGHQVYSEVTKEVLAFLRQPCSGTTDIEPPGTVDVPREFVLLQNYPNPFNPTTRIEWRMPESRFVSLKVYDILGREVAILVNENLNPGNHERTFDGTGLASGVYFYRFIAGSFSASKKFMIVK